MRCAIPTCKSDHTSSSGISFFRLPETPFLDAAWKKIISETGWQLKPGSVVCSKHFLKKDFFDTTSDRHMRPGASSIVEENVPDEDSMSQFNVKVCRVCFLSDCKLHLIMTSGILHKAYEKLVGVSKLDQEYLPCYMCEECADQLLDCVRFKSKVADAHDMLWDLLLKHGLLTLKLIQSSRLSCTSPSNDSFHGSLVEEEYRLTNAQGNTKLDDTVIDKNVDDVNMETDYVIHQSIINNDEITNDDEDEVIVIDDLFTQDNVNAYPADAHEDIEVDVVTNTNYDANSQDDRSVCLSNVSEDVVVDDALENDINKDNISNQDLINEETNKRLVYSANFYEQTVGNMFNISSSNEQNHKSSEQAANNYTHSFEFIGEHVMEEKHSKAQAASRSFICDVCGFKTTRKYSLSRHIQVHSRRKLHSCKSCKKEFSEKKSLNVHMKKHSTRVAVAGYLCDICHKTFREKRSLVRHLKTHNEPIVCGICEKQFVTLGGLKQHLVVHTGQKPYGCTFCNRVFRGKGNLQKHLRVHSEPIRTIEDYLSCEVCEQLFSTKQGLDEHLERHGKIHTCIICNISVRGRDKYNLHLKTHPNEKPFSCDICKKKYKSEAILNYHIRKGHLKKGSLSSTVSKKQPREKRHCCNICNKLLSTQSSLRVHLKIHSGKKPYSCNICSKLLRHKDHLNKHLKAHAGSKQYTCDHCKRMFKHKASIVLHIMEDHLKK